LLANAGGSNEHPRKLRRDPLWCFHSNSQPPKRHVKRKTEHSTTTSNALRSSSSSSRALSSELTPLTTNRHRAQELTGPDPRFHAGCWRGGVKRQTRGASTGGSFHRPEASTSVRKHQQGAGPFLIQSNQVDRVPAAAGKDRWLQSPKSVEVTWPTAY
jgi:hypothetical protein